MPYNSNLLEGCSKSFFFCSAVKNSATMCSPRLQYANDGVLCCFQPLVTVLVLNISCFPSGWHVCAGSAYIWLKHVLRVDLWCSLGVIVPSILRSSSLCNDVYLYVTGSLPPCSRLAAVWKPCFWHVPRHSASLDDVELYVAACAPPRESQ